MNRKRLLLMGGRAIVAAPIFYADRFYRADGALGNFDGGHTDESWDQTTWTISGNKAINTPSLGIDKITNGDFAAWTLGNPDWWTPVEALPNNEISETGGGGHGTGGAGQCNFYSTSATLTRLVANNIMTVGQWYQVDFDVNAVVAGALRVYDSGGRSLLNINTTGSKSLVLDALGVQINFANNGAAADVTVDNIILRQIAFSSMVATKDMAFADGEFRVRVVCNPMQPAGLILSLDDETTPQNYILITVRAINTVGADDYIHVKQCLAGTYTELSGSPATVTYSANAEIRAVKSGTSYTVYYNNLLVGTFTANAAITSNTRHGIFSSHPSSELKSYIAIKSLNYPECAAYLGGSVLLGNNATVINQTSTRGLTMAWLEANHLSSVFYFVNSTLGGRMSWSHLIQLDADAITRKAALVILDCAVNDLNTDIYKRSEEALVRRLLNMSPRPKLLGVIFIRVTDIPGNDDTNTYQTTEDNLVALFTHYGIPIANVATQIQSLVPGTNNLTDFFSDPDTVHMIDGGHAIAAPLLEAELASLSPVTGALPARLIAGSDDYENAPVVRLGTANDGETGTWTTTSGIRQSVVADSTMTFIATCQSIGLDQYGGTGVWQYSVDGGAFSANQSGEKPNGIDLGLARASRTIVLKVISGTVKVYRFLAI